MHTLSLLPALLIPASLAMPARMRWHEVTAAVPEEPWSPAMPSPISRTWDEKHTNAEPYIALSPYGNRKKDHNPDLAKNPGRMYPSDHAIYFTTPLTGQTILAISTQWHIDYHEKVEAKLRAQLHAVVLEKEPTDEGWYHLKTVTKSAVQRGMISWHHPMARDSSYPEAFKPSEEVERVLTEILLNTYPTTEIAVCIGVSLGIFLAIVGIVVYCARCSRWSSRLRVANLPRE